MFRSTPVSNFMLVDKCAQYHPNCSLSSSTRLVDWHGDRLDGTFYEPELQKVIVPVGKTYRIESELRRRNNGREVLVKWFGYPESFNSWIDVRTLKSYK